MASGSEKERMRWEGDFLYLLLCRLNGVLEFAEDIEIDIPMIWDYLGEILAFTVTPKGGLSLRILSGVPPALVTCSKAAVLVAKTLRGIRSLLSEAEAIAVWSESQLQWYALGVNTESQAEFLRAQVCVIGHVTVIADMLALLVSCLFSLQKLEFLPAEPPPLVDRLATLLGSSDKTNDEILDWIEVRGKPCKSNCHLWPQTFTQFISPSNTHSVHLLQHSLPPPAHTHTHTPSSFSNTINFLPHSPSPPPHRLAAKQR